MGKREEGGLISIARLSSTNSNNITNRWKKFKIPAATTSAPCVRQVVPTTTSSSAVDFVFVLFIPYVWMVLRTLIKIVIGVASTASTVSSVASNVKSTSDQIAWSNVHTVSVDIGSTPSASTACHQPRQRRQQICLHQPSQDKPTFALSIIAISATTNQKHPSSNAFSAPLHIVNHAGQLLSTCWMIENILPASSTCKIMRLSLPFQFDSWQNLSRQEYEEECVVQVNIKHLLKRMI